MAAVTERKERVDQVAAATAAPPAFPQHNSCFQRAMYCLSRPMATLALYRVRHPWLLNVVSLQDSPYHCRELMTDIGAEFHTITHEHGTLDAAYFDPKKFQTSHGKAFEKWRALLALPAYKKTADILEADLKGKDFRALLGLPETIEEIRSDDILGVVVALGAGNIFAFNPQAAIMHLLRGKHVLLFDYSGIMHSKGTPGWEQTCQDAHLATAYFRDRLRCRNEQIIVHGTSMGTGPAVWTAAQPELAGINVIFDRGPANMPDVVETQAPLLVRPLATYAARHFYRYPNDELIPFIKGRVLIMQAKDDAIIPACHAERIFQALAKSKLGKTEGAEVAAFAKKYWIKAAGTHSSIAGGDPDYSWYRDAATQAQLNAFFSKA